MVKIKINKIYNNENMLLEMRKFFENETFIQLNEFLNNADKIKSILKEKKFVEKYNPMKFKYSELNLNKEFDFEIIKFIEFFKSKEFLNFIEDIVDFELIFKEIKIQKFKHRDFTILNDKEIENDDSIEIIYDFTEDWEKRYGGYLTYTSKEEEMFYLEPGFNSLTIMYKPQGIMKYTKYVNNLSKNKEIVRISIKFEIKEEI